MSRARALALLALSSSCACARDLSFEVASVKPAAPMASSSSSSGTARGIATLVSGAITAEEHGRVRMKSVTLSAMLQRAYGIPASQIEGPQWMAENRFDVDAKIPDGASAEQIPEMLRTLLAERFLIAVHRDQRPRPIYALEPIKSGTHMRPAGDTDERVKVSLAARARKIAGPVTIVNLINILSRSVDRPIVDKTGLTGVFSIQLEWAQTEGALSDDGMALPSLFTALKESAGLQLVPDKTQVSVLIVDKVTRHPTDN